MTLTVILDQRIQPQGPAYMLHRQITVIDVGDGPEYVKEFDL